MLGYVGLPADPSRARRLERLSAASTSLMHVEGGFAVAMTPAAGTERHDRILRAEIAADPRHVLAFEGYLCDLPPAQAMRPAAWLLEQYGKRGLAAFEYLNGAYALCLFDRREQTAWMGACSFGRRDLFYLRERQTLVFATDLSGVLRLAARPPGLAADRLASCVLSGALFGDTTLLRGVRRVLHGALVRYHDGEIVELPVGPLAPPGTIAPDDEEALLDELDARFRTAVRRLQRVTAGQTVLMGAGVDSSVAAAYVKAVTGRLDTVTLHLPIPPDETEGARAITHALGGVHHVCTFDLDRVDPLAQLAEFVRVVEEPTAFGLGLMMMSLARTARAVADGFVCGSAADTLFGDPVDGFDDPNPDSIYHYMFREISADHARQVLRLRGPHDEVIPRMRASLPPDPGLQSLHLMMLTHTLLMVRIASRLALAHRGEALFPYLDRDLFSLALAIPVQRRVNDKPLLRALAARHYSAALLPPGKFPFTFYPIKWLHARKRLDPLLDLLEDQRTRERGVYLRKGLARLVDAWHAASEPPDSKWRLVLWQVVVLELFCRQFVDGVGLDASEDLHASRVGMGL